MQWRHLWREEEGESERRDKRPHGVTPFIERFFMVSEHFREIGSEINPKNFLLNNLGF